MNNRHYNPILATDSYKASHWLQYPEGTEAMFSYVEARNQQAPNDFTVFFGLTPIIQDYLHPITQENIDEAANFFAAHGEPFNKASWQHILEKHGGNFPVEIKAVPEGTVVPNGNVLLTVESTDPEVPWIASYVETLLLRVWYPTTVATKSFRCKQVIKSWMERTCDDLSGLPFKLHDFGARGVSSGESALIGGMAHLVNFAGTDTVEAAAAMHRYYPMTTPVPAYSIPAAEHSTITAWGKENEVDAYRNMLKAYGGKGHVVSVVSDSYDIYNACEKLWGEELREELVKSGSTLVIRPDSGDPLLVIPKLLKILDSKFGSTTNSKGYKVLNHVRLIQGDGIDSPETIDRILFTVANNGFSTDNIAFGMGGGLLQHCNRDTFGFAMKCSAIKVNGEWRDVFKQPVDQPNKKSKKGRLTLVREKGEFSTMTEQEARAKGWADGRFQYLLPVFRNGKFVRGDDSLETIRERTGQW